jgi:hypothetical protein
MRVAPRPGFKYRDTRTQQLVPAEGYEADPADLDVARALACGDLIEVKAQKAAPASSKE